jgi:hypothetical protein
MMSSSMGGMLWNRRSSTSSSASSSSPAASTSPRAWTWRCRSTTRWYGRRRRRTPR